MTGRRADVYSRITAEIAAAIEAGVGEWTMPWHHEGAALSRPPNVASGRRYRGVNVLALWIAAHAAGHGSGLWGTYRQWLALGAQVRKGERATTAVLWKEIARRKDQGGDKDGDEEPTGRGRLVARAFSVFHAGQVEGNRPPAAEPSAAVPGVEAADAFVAALGVPITYGAHDAHYRIDLDRIFLPPRDAFDDTAAFYGTLLHEAAHATGAKHRLDRDFGARFGDGARAIEEITAELTARFVLADLGIAHRPRPDHAAYVASWLRALKNDPRAIFTASAKAQAAADWMHARQDRPETAAA